MNRETIDRDAILDHLDAVLDETEVAVELGVVFGSRARDGGDASSDTDVLLVSTDFVGVPGHRRAEAVLRRWDHARYGAIDVLCYTPEEYCDLRERDERTLPDRALAEGIVVIGATTSDERREGAPSTKGEL